MKRLRPIVEFGWVAGLFATNASAHRSVTTFADKAAWKAAVGALTVIDFLSHDDGTPICAPHSGVELQEGISLRGVYFTVARNEWGLSLRYQRKFVYAYKPTPVRALLPTGTTAVAVELGSYPLENYLVRLSSGETYSLPGVPTNDITLTPTRFFGVTATSPIEWIELSIPGKTRDGSVYLVAEFLFGRNKQLRRGLASVLR